ncbi:unnamed protein product [Phytophthora fragariaefolia]|uniref:Unnamed protein product n=1 Tax=Phytophthora fragariaefolia TaxID=1490495 RepID=A0A9W7CHS6_9STRA|nr:unnamed protein product [Phytophthora fragariaefolia]
MSSSSAAWFLAQIDDLQAQLASAHSASTSTSAQGLRVSMLEAELHHVSADRDEARLQAVQIDEAARALEASSVALETATVQLRRQARDSQRQLDRAHEECDHLRSRAELAKTQLKKTATEILQRTQDRDRVAAMLRSTQTQVAAARSSIARLEHRANGLLVDPTHLDRAKDENASLTTELSSTRRRCSSLEAAQDHDVADCDAIRARNAGLMSFAQPATPPSRSTSPTPQPQPSSRKRRRSQSVSMSPSSRGRVRRGDDSAAASEHTTYRQEEGGDEATDPDDDVDSETSPMLPRRTSTSVLLSFETRSALPPNVVPRES